jgi:hypothetical protein
LNNLYKENKGLFYSSLVSVLIILTGLYYGFTVFETKRIREENKQLINTVDSLKTIIKNSN